MLSRQGHYPPRRRNLINSPCYMLCRMFNFVFFVSSVLLERAELLGWWRSGGVCEGKRWQAGWLGRWQAGGVGERRQKLGGLLLRGIWCDILRQRAEVQDQRCRRWSTQPMQNQPLQTLVILARLPQTELGGEGVPQTLHCRLCTQVLWLLSSKGKHFCLCRVR